MSTNIKYAVLAVDVAVFSLEGGELRVLVTKSNNKYFKGKRSLIGGLVKPFESLEQAATRYFRDFIDYPKNPYIEQVYTFGGVKRDPSGRVVSTTYMALIHKDDIKKLKPRGKYNYLDWVNVKDLPKMAYDHNRMVDVSIERIRGKLSYTTLVSKLLPQNFTLTDLQRAYEVVLEKELDKRNLRKKLLSLDLLSETGRKTQNQNFRPASLYKFRNSEVINIDIF